jgi:hypothetical protein
MFNDENLAAETLVIENGCGERTEIGRVRKAG